MITRPNTRALSLPALALTLTLCACSTTGTPVPSNNPRSTPVSATLYDQLGGQLGLQRLSEQLIIEIAADDRIRPRFAKTDISRFHRMMQEHLCELTDGPCTYSGDNMQRTHGGMNIQPNEFNAVVEALMRAMDDVQLPVSSQNQLLSRLAPLRSQVIRH